MKDHISSIENSPISVRSRRIVQRCCVGAWLAVGLTSVACSADDTSNNSIIINSAANNGQTQATNATPGTIVCTPEAPCVCPAGETCTCDGDRCEFQCPEGACTVQCSGEGTTCLVTQCSVAGSCVMECDDADCFINTCPVGGCQMNCSSQSFCEIETCESGGCALNCTDESRCTISECRDGGCTADCSEASCDLEGCGGGCSSSVDDPSGVSAFGSTTSCHAGECDMECLGQAECALVCSGTATCEVTCDSSSPCVCSHQDSGECTCTGENCVDV